MLLLRVHQHKRGIFFFRDRQYTMYVPNQAKFGLNVLFLFVPISIIHLNTSKNMRCLLELLQYENAY